MSLINLALSLWNRLDLDEFKNRAKRKNEFSFIAKSHVGQIGELSFHAVSEGSSTLIYMEGSNCAVDIREVDRDTILQHTVSQVLRQKYEKRLIDAGFIGGMLLSSPVEVTHYADKFLYQMLLPDATIAEDFLVNFINSCPPESKRRSSYYRPSRRQQRR